MRCDLSRMELAPSPGASRHHQATFSPHIGISTAPICVLSNPTDTIRILMRYHYPYPYPHRTLRAFDSVSFIHVIYP